MNYKVLILNLWCPIPIYSHSLLIFLCKKQLTFLYVEKAFKDKTHVDNLSKDSFHELFTRTFSESLILFDQEFCKQHNSVAMGSPLGPKLANAFLPYHEKNWPQNSPSQFKPVIYSRYIDGTFLLFRSKYHITKFRNYLNCQYRNIRFNSKIEN